MVDTIYQMGNDALQNQGRVIISPLQMLDMVEALQFRITSLPTIPGYKIMFNDFSYKGYTISLAKPGDDQSRTSSFTFRVDKYWKVYKMLRAWGKVIHDHTADDAGLGDNDAVRTPIQVSVENGPSWVFTGCIYESLSDIDLDNTDSGTPITCTFTFRYLTVDMVEN